MVKNLLASAGHMRGVGSVPGPGRSPGGGYDNSTPVCLPGESHEQSRLFGYGPQCLKESDTTEVTQQ